MNEETIEVEVVVDTSKAIKQIEDLNQLLQEANTLADELTSTLNSLKFDIEI